MSVRLLVQRSCNHCAHCLISELHLLGSYLLAHSCSGQFISGRVYWLLPADLVSIQKRPIRLAVALMRRRAVVASTDRHVGETTPLVFFLREQVQNKAAA